MKRAAAAGLLAVWLVAAFAAHAGAASVEQQYAEIKADYKTLLASERKQVYRHNWLRVIEAFKRLQKRFPKSSRADDALYMAAGAYRELHVYSYLKDDLENAVGLYDQVADKYPASNLADDALVYAGEILEKLGRREDAYARYHRCAVKFGKAISPRKRATAKAPRGLRAEKNRPRRHPRRRLKTARSRRKPSGCRLSGTSSIGAIRNTRASSSSYRSARRSSITSWKNRPTANSRAAFTSTSPAL
ncbi:MAG: tetratricopeptide repeat protein [Deltaproteobacteria bacterium]|nr:tetratricopeptide repeat protein [Deltaproteobacteria bacterium]